MGIRPGFDWLRAVAFDMDGLILDTEVVYREGWRAAGAEQGVEITDEVFARYLGVRLVDCERLLQIDYGAGFDAPQFIERGREHSREYFAAQGVPRKPGVVELMDVLAEARLPFALATSTHRAGAQPRLAELWPRFAAAATGDEVKHGKPAPDIYLLAAGRLGISPGGILALEDSEAGAQAALAAGMRAIIVPDLVHPGPATVDRLTALCTSLTEVRNLIFD